jgi:RNA exonuclease 4
MSEMDAIRAAVRASMARDAQLEASELATPPDIAYQSRLPSVCATPAVARRPVTGYETHVANPGKPPRVEQHVSAVPQPWMDAKMERLGKKRDKDRKRKERSKVNEPAVGGKSLTEEEDVTGSASKPALKRAKYVAAPAPCALVMASALPAEGATVAASNRPNKKNSIENGNNHVRSNAPCSIDLTSFKERNVSKAVKLVTAAKSSVVQVSGLETAAVKMPTSVPSTPAVPASAVKRSVSVDSNWNELRKTMTPSPSFCTTRSIASRQRGFLPSLDASGANALAARRRKNAPRSGVTEMAPAEKQEQQVKPLQGSMFVRGALRTGPAVKPTKIVSLDCEYVGVGEGGKDDALARASLVNSRGEVLYDSYVRIDRPVVDYRTFVSGVRKEDVTGPDASDPKTARREIASLLRGRILVGHAVSNDLRVMRIAHPQRDIRDTSVYYKKLWKRDGRRGGAPPALRLVVARILGVDQFQTHEHDSCEDARAALALYKKASKEWEAQRRKRV